MFMFSSRFKLGYSELQKRVFYCIKFLMKQYIPGTAVLSVKVMLCQVPLVLCYFLCHSATEKLENLKLPCKTVDAYEDFLRRMYSYSLQFSVLEVCMKRLSFSCTLWASTLKDEPQPGYVFVLFVIHSLKVFQPFTYQIKILAHYKLFCSDGSQFDSNLQN